MRRRLLLICALGMALLAGPVAAIASGTVPVRARPGSGHPGTTFTVSLRLPLATGTSGTMRRTDTVSVSGPRRHGCVSAATRPVPQAAANRLVRVRFVPRKLGGRWCVGTFHGTVSEAQSVVCPPEPGFACPMLAIRPQVIGRFSFRVRR